MSDRDYSDATLVLLGHGSTRNPRSGAPVSRHAAALRATGLFAEVLEAFWLAEPRVTGLWDRIRTARVFLVPLFISEGYLTTQAMPQALGLQLQRSPRAAAPCRIRGVTSYYCPPVGTHPAMTDALLARAETVLHEHPTIDPSPPDSIALIVVGHGTDLNGGSRAAVEHQVTTIRARGPFAEVHPAFLEQPPKIDDYHRFTTAPNLVIVPLFISDGLHTLEDIPVRLGEPEAHVKRRLAAGEPTWRNPTRHHGKQIWYTAAIGNEPIVREIIIQRVREAVLG